MTARRKSPRPLDAFLVARKVEPTGQEIGIDMIKVLTHFHYTTSLFDQDADITTGHDRTGNEKCQLVWAVEYIIHRSPSRGTRSEIA